MSNSFCAAHDTSRRTVPRRMRDAGNRHRLWAGSAWVALAVAVVGPVLVAAASPLLAWRGPVYVVAGFAGIVAMALLLIQPLLATGHLPGIHPGLGRTLHRWTGAVLTAAVVIHVGGLWIFSPPDVIDALLLSSPTPFSIWGVAAMWAVFAAAAVAAMRRRLRVSPRTWRRTHTALAMAIVLSSAAHAVLVEGTMGTVSKWLLCALAITATFGAVADGGAWRRRRDPSAHQPRRHPGSRISTRTPGSRASRDSSPP